MNTQYKKAKKFVFCAFFNNYSNLIDKKRRFLVSKAFETSKAGARRFFIPSATATARPSSPFPSGAVSSGTGAGCFMNTRRARRRRFFILSDKRKRMQTNDNGHGCSLRNGGGLFLHPGHTIRRGQTISGGRSQFATAGALPQDQRKRMQTPSNYQPRQRARLGLFLHQRRANCLQRRKLQRAAFHPISHGNGAPVAAVPVWGWGCLRIVAAAVA